MPSTRMMVNNTRFSPGDKVKPSVIAFGRSNAIGGVTIAENLGSKLGPPPWIIIKQDRTHPTVYRIKSVDACDEDYHLCNSAWLQLNSKEYIWTIPTKPTEI